MEISSGFYTRYHSICIVMMRYGVSVVVASVTITDNIQPMQPHSEQRVTFNVQWVHVI